MTPLGKEQINTSILDRISAHQMMFVYVSGSGKFFKGIKVCSVVFTVLQNEICHVLTLNILVLNFWISNVPDCFSWMDFHSNTYFLYCMTSRRDSSLVSNMAIPPNVISFHSISEWLWMEINFIESFPTLYISPESISEEFHSKFFIKSKSHKISIVGQNHAAKDTNQRRSQQ